MPAVIEKLLENGLMPVVSPLSADSNGILLNINADTVAAAIGGALSAEKLVLCTGAQGILERVEDPSSVVSYTDIKGLKRLRDQGSLKDGMLPKAAAIESAIRGGVRRVHVISYRSADSLARGDLHQRGHRHAGGGGSHRLEPRGTVERSGMTRLWDKGTAARRPRARDTRRAMIIVLDNRLVRYDIQASIAHAEMLRYSGLLVGAGSSMRSARP